MENLSLQTTVDNYCSYPESGLRNSIISKSMPLIRSIIGKINRPDQPLTQREDLESAGISGLIQALDSYDSTKNIQFNTFAYYRIRGNVIDYLRKIDQLPRKQRKTYGQVQEIIRRKSQELGRKPSEDEIARELNMTLSEYQQLLTYVQQRNALSLDNTLDEDSGTYYEIHADPDSVTPDSNLEKKELAECLKRKIGQLEERDRLILTLYYYEEMTMSEIALLLELSEARISQIVGKLLIQLKSDLMGEEVFQSI